MNPIIRRRVRRLRAADPWQPLSTALAIASAVKSPDAGEYADLLEAFSQDAPVTGPVGPFMVRVRTEADDSFELGQDDVTGTFTDKNESGVIPNKGAGHGAYKYYLPSTYARTDLLDDMRRRGMSRSVAREQYALTIEEAMNDDRERYALGVVVTVTLDGAELANESLWGIDQIARVDGTSYLIEVARELITEALGRARENLPKAVERAERHVEVLRANLS